MLLTNMLMKIIILIPALIQVESSGNWDAYNPDGSYGGLQITQSVINDMKNIDPDGVYTMYDAYTPAPAKKICQKYLLYYGEKYYRKTGKIPSYQQFARMWNGGPDGWRKDATLPYWKKVSRQLTRRGVMD